MESITRHFKIVIKLKRPSLLATIEPGESRGAFVERIRRHVNETVPPVAADHRGGAETILRNVRWFYRAEVKSPKDTITAISREYAKQVGRTNDARSVVQKGINEAKRLLDSAAFICDAPA